MLDRILIGSSAEPSDPNFENVTLLLHGDGSNGAQNNTFIDSSTNNFTITRNGNTTQGSFSPYGSNWGCYFDGTSDYLTYTGGSSLNFGTGDFTIELFVFLENTGTYSPFLRPDASTTTPEFGYDFSSGQLKFDQRNGPIVAVTTTMPTNQWAHVAVSRSGTSLRLFINGAQVGSTVTNSTNWTSPSGDIRIGGSSFSSTHNVKGYISNFRVLNGTALYTGSYTVPTAPLTAITNTSLLTCAYNRFRDGSTNNFTITRNGDVKVTNFAPFAPSSAYSTTTNGGSAYFDGTGDWLTGSSSIMPSTSTSTFTIEGWVYPTTFANRIDIIGDMSPSVSSDTKVIAAEVNTSGQVALYWFDGAIRRCTGNTAMVLNQWNYFAIVVTSNAIAIYVNRTTADTLSGTTTLTNRTQTHNFALGSYYGEPAFRGYLSNIRVSTVARTISSVPSSPVSSDANTRVLINATNAAIFDNSMKNDLETVGNAQISTSVKKFGTGSMSFVRSPNSYLVAPNTSSQFSFGEGNFTIEAWIYMNTLPGGNGYSSSYWIVGGGLVNSNTGFDIAIGSTNLQIGLSSFASLNIDTAHGMSANIWYHVAVVRSGATLYAFINGSQLATASVSGISADPCLTGISVSAAEPTGATAGNFDGYIDELRITKGVARYTANFTPPTAPFPNK